MKKIYFIIAALFCLTVCSCTLKEDYAKGTIQTVGVTNVTGNSARLQGRVSIEEAGNDPDVVVNERGFYVYIPDVPDGMNRHVPSGSDGEGDFECTVNELNSLTTYCFRAYAKIKYDRVYGSTMEFTTERDGSIRLDSIISIGSITYTTASVSGKVLFEGIPPYTELGLCYSTQPEANLTGRKTAISANGDGTFSATLIKLNAGTTYYVQAYALNREMTAYSSEESFTTSDGSIHVDVAGASNITQTSATITGTVIFDGVPPYTERGFCYSTWRYPDLAEQKLVVPGEGTGTFNGTLTGLSPDITYYVRAYATNGETVAYSAEESFKTLDGSAIIDSVIVSDITNVSATIHGNIIFEGIPPYTERGFLYAISPTNLSVDGWQPKQKVIIPGSGAGAFETALTGLTPTTTYYVTAYTLSGTEAEYSPVESFTTLDGTIYLGDIVVSNVTNTSAAVGGEIIAEGIPPYSERGLCYSTSPNPNLETGQKLVVPGSGKGIFDVTLAGLEPGTAYHVKAYAQNNETVAYSKEKNFTTLDVPSVTSLRIEDVDGNGMSVLGKITRLGAEEVTDYGVCYSTVNSVPTINDSKVSSGNTSATGSFKVQVTGLELSTGYYFRTYARNSVGITYGEVLQGTTSAFKVALNLVAYYTFDGVDNINFLSEAQGKSQYEGIKQGVGDPVYSSDIPGTAGHSLQLNNDAYYVMTESPVAAITSSYTMNVWVKSYVTTQTLFRYEDTGGGRKPAVAFNNGYVYAEINYNVSYQNVFNIDITALTLDGTWHMLTVTRESGVCKLYIDGVYRVSTSSNATHTGRWYLGQGFTGRMDNLRIYNRELKQNEITKLYNDKE
jgi:hypothetical protein